jgi:hypothetical protein
MSTDRGDLEDLLVIVEDFADKVLAEASEVDLALIESTPLPTLVSDLLEAQVPDALAWTFEVVEAVAQRSASWGFVLASRYAAQFSLVGEAEVPTACFVAAGVDADGELVVPAAPMAAGSLESLVVLTEVGLSRLADAVVADMQPGRTGLAGAQLTRVTGRAGAPLQVTNERAWPVLLGAVVCGLGSALSRQAVLYTLGREQFGTVIASFPGLRAVVGTANAELRRARAQLYAHALGEGATPLAEAVASAADTVVDGAIDAVQSMGGYGYIDEFPVAGMFRDAVSLRARADSALSGWRAAAELAYALEGQGK